MIAPLPVALDSVTEWGYVPDTMPQQFNRMPDTSTVMERAQRVPPFLRSSRVPGVAPFT